MHQIDMAVDYHIISKCYQRYSSKLINIAKLKDCVVDDMG